MDNLINVILENVYNTLKNGNKGSLNNTNYKTQNYIKEIEISKNLADYLNAKKIKIVNKVDMFCDQKDFIELAIFMGNNINNIKNFITN